MEDRILAIQRQLSQLRNDRTKFFSVSDVLSLYIDFNAVVAESRGSSDLQPLIEDTYLIFSLAITTSGHSREPISIFAKLTSLRILYRFIYSDMAITPKELGLLDSSVEQAKSGPEEVGDVNIPDVEYIDKRNEENLKHIYDYGSQMDTVMQELPESQLALFIQIAHFRRTLLSEAINPESNASRLNALAMKFEKINSHVLAIQSTEPLAPVLDFQWHRTSMFLEWYGHGISLEAMEAEDPGLVPAFRRLIEILPELDVFVLTRRWTLRATDLYQYLKYLMSVLPMIQIVPESDEPGRPPMVLHKDGQSKYKYLVTYMARKAWVQIFKLLDTTEPVSEALSSLYNQLVTMKRLLNEVQLAGGISNLRELYPYELSLASLDNSRTDGKFVVNGEIPPGQGVLNGILAECFDMVYELKVELEEKGEEDGDDSQLLLDEDDDRQPVKESAHPLVSSDMED